MPAPTPVQHPHHPRALSLALSSAADCASLIRLSACLLLPASARRRLFYLMRDVPAQPQTSPRARDAWANQGPAPLAVQDAARRRARAGACPGAGAGAARVGRGPRRASVLIKRASKQSTRPRPAERGKSHGACRSRRAEERSLAGRRRGRGQDSMFGRFSGRQKTTALR